MSTIEKAQTKKFDTEVGKILKLVIHSLYTNKDIFLRELISNSSDACDKARYLAIQDPGLVSDNAFKVKVTINEADKTLSISDNGIGMNGEDLINNIGTIASSGTQKFVEQLSGDLQKDNNLIGQFGVGFYSAFMIAKEIAITTRKQGEKDVWHWKSDGNEEYKIEKLTDSDFPCGTEVKLYLKEGMDEYLDKFRIRHIIKTYSDHISFPIELSAGETESEIVNSASALWQKSKGEITEEQYKEFYKQIAHLPDIPWLTIHNRNEGTVSYTNLLFIPSMKPFDLFSPERKPRVKLYIKKVFISEDSVELIPAYLRFLRGVIDSEDLPLNISRETLQHNNILEKIKKSVTGKVLSELKKKLADDPSDYKKFWQDFGQVLKEGLCEASDFREKILEVCLFKSALTGEQITLDQYIAKMHPKQKNIYYVCGEESQDIVNTPQLEGLIKNNIDVLIFNDHVDDFWVNVQHEYKDHEFKSVTRSGIDAGEFSDDKLEEEKEESAEEHKNLIEYCKKVLGSNVKDIKISKKLVDSPVCLSVVEGAMDIRMEKYLLDNKQIASESAKVLEINIKHPLLIKLESLIEANDLIVAEDLTKLLYDQALILENQNIKEPGNFAKRFNQFLIKALV